MNFELILSFLKQIKQNNSREWMEENKKLYIDARDEFVAITKHVIDEVAKFDPALASLDPKKSIFRLNRDIRFSKNKDPYKTNFGAYMMEGGKKAGKAGYYLHLEPGNESFIAGGVYMPESDKLAKIRQEIDYNGKEFVSIISQNNFKSIFKTVEGDRLKRPPKGYLEDHPHIDLLKLKSFLVVHKITDEQVMKSDFPQFITATFKAMLPFNNFLNVALQEG